MRIVFTHNLKKNDTLEESEFDSAETVQAIVGMLMELEHDVISLDVTGNVSKVTTTLEAFSPDIIFNTAEGEKGKFRESLYPTIFDNMGIPYTGSDGLALGITLDKQLAKWLVEKVGVRVPKGYLFSDAIIPNSFDLRFPLILKPNHEGSSKGITLDSIVESYGDLEGKLKKLLEIFKEGILAEEYIEGRDLAVPFIENFKNGDDGILSPIIYSFSKEINDQRKYNIYDYELKNNLAQHVHVEIANDLPPNVFRELKEFSKKAIKALNIRDIGRIDFRLDNFNNLYFLEVNALPSLEPGAGLYLAAKKSGLKTDADVLEKILQSACLKNGIKYEKKRRVIKNKLRIGLAFNQKRVIPNFSPDTDIEAEYDSPKTISFIKDAIAGFGHEVIEIEANSDFAERLIHSKVDIVFNISEGLKGRYRESQVPALLDLVGIPYTGSDPSSMALTLDKGLAKRIVREAGVKTPNFYLFINGKEKIPEYLKYPLMLKPVAEGSSKGILKSSVIHNEKELKEGIAQITTKYKQAAMAEEFLTGREFTVALLGEKRPEILPPMEIVFKKADERFPIYTYEHKLEFNDEIEYQVPANIDQKLKDKLEKAAKKCFTALGCRDVARIDFRLDSDGEVNFIECNPLPGLTPDWSDICLIGKGANISYQDLIGRILGPAIRRYKEIKKEKKSFQTNNGEK